MIRPAFGTEYGAMYITDSKNFFMALKDYGIDTIFADTPFNLDKDYGNGAGRANALATKILG